MSINEFHEFNLWGGELFVGTILVFEKLVPSLEHEEATTSNSELTADLDEVVGTC